MIFVVDMNREGSLTHHEFIEPILAIAGDRTVHHTRLSQEGVDGADALILSGTPLKDRGYLADKGLLGFLRETDVPILGICAGMQALCAAYGGETIECTEIGMICVHTAVENPLFEGDFKAYALHTLSSDIPVGFEELARSENCIQAIGNMKKGVYGTLFHPEVRNIDIIRRFADSV